MKTLTASIFLFAVLLGSTAWADDYAELQEQADALRASPSNNAKARDELTRIVVGLSDVWLGTTWGLGRPQSAVPGQGKINCGTFVGTLLVHAGLNVNHKKLQRQPAELIIKSFASGDDIKRFRNRPMQAFLDGVRQMGDGLYIIGLDFHVGFLLVAGQSVRFIHASYVTETVVNEDAATAIPIQTSRYRVVGRVFTKAVLKKWRDGQKITVVGSW